MSLSDLLHPEELLKAVLDHGSWIATVAVLAIVFAESGLLIGFFLPGDSLLFTAGVFAAKGDLNIAAISIGCAVAAVVGDQVGYAFGRRVGPALFRRPDSRFFKQAYVDRANEYFAKHGAKTIVLARFVPIVRTFAPVVAGVSRMDYRTFVTYNVVGGVVWGSGVSLAGYALGSVIGDDIDRYLLPIIGLIVVLSVLPPAIEWYRHRRSRTPVP